MHYCQLEMINIIKESVCNKTIIPTNAIIGIDDIMENRRILFGRKKLAMIYSVVGAVSVLGVLLMAWLITSRIWWGLVVYISLAVFGLLISVFQLKNSTFVCPKCDSDFKPPLKRVFFSTGSHKVRWMTCTKCGHKDWCVLQNPNNSAKGVI